MSAGGGRFVAVMYGSALLPHAVLVEAALVSSALTLLGAGPVVVGASSLVSNLGTVASYLAAPLLLPLFGTRRRMVAVASAGMVVALAGMAGAIAIGGGRTAVAVMVTSLALYHLASGARGLPWADLMRQKICRERRIALVTRTIVLSLVVATLASWGMKALLDSPLGFPASYLAIFLAATGSAGIGLLLVAALRTERPSPAGPGARGFLRHALGRLRAPSPSPVVALTLAASFFLGLVSGASGLYVSAGYLRDPAEMSRIIGAAFVVRTAVKAVAYLAAGRVATRVGNKAVLLAVCAVSAVAPLGSLLLPFRLYLLVLVATNLMPMFDPFMVNILMNESSDDDFPARFTLYNVMRFPLSLLMPLLGLLVERAMPVFDALILLCLAAAAVLVARLPRGADRN